MEIIDSICDRTGGRCVHYGRAGDVVTRRRFSRSFVISRVRVIIALFRRSPRPTDEATLAGEIRTTAISWDVLTWIYVNEVPEAGWRHGAHPALCKPADRRCTRPAEGLDAYAMDLVVIEA
jgi:hypothetical protein